MQDKDIKIFPLSEDERTNKHNKNHTNFSVYKDFLDAAFDDSRIRNIAITGAFGIGKSSVIHSYDFAIHQKNSKYNLQRIQNSEDDGKQTFLYVSLGQFAAESKENDAGDSGHGVGQFPSEESEGTAESGKSSSKKQSDQVNKIERRLLLQIYARFQRKDLPASSFKLIPEELSHRKAIATCIGALVLMTLFLACYETFETLLICIIPSSAGYTSSLHFLLLCLYFVFLFIVATVLSYWVISRLKMKGISVKAEAMEMDLEKQTDLSYIDQYSTEIIYCLEHISGKIDDTVVFEDLDRFSSDMCIEIFTRLHEINCLINARLHSQSKGYIRFIYVINDEILGCLQQTKFFDYIMPVVPVLNGGSAEIILRRNIEKIRDIAPQNELMRSACEKLLSDDRDSLVHKVAPYLQDFRTQYSILNEFSLLFHIYVSKNPHQHDEADAEQVFAFAIYKTMWPKDYSRIRDRKSEFFPICNLLPDSKKWRGIDNRELLEILLGKNQRSENPDSQTQKPRYLNMRCLYYIGFDENEVAAERIRILRGNCAQETKLAIINGICDQKTAIVETASVKEVTAYCSEFNFEKIVCDKNGKLSVNDEHREQFDILTAVIQCVVRCSWRDNAWFFKGKDINRCIRILAELKSDDVNEFIKLSYHGYTEPDQDSVFALCEGWENIDGSNYWTSNTWEIFLRGTRSWKSKNGKQKKVHIENASFEIEEELKKKKAII